MCDTGKDEAEEHVILECGKYDTLNASDLKISFPGSSYPRIS